MGIWEGGGEGHFNTAKLCIPFKRSGYTDLMDTVANESIQSGNLYEG